MAFPTCRQFVKDKPLRIFTTSFTEQPLNLYCQSSSSSRSTYPPKTAMDIILAASASPSALTTFSCLSCLAFSTMNMARWASCWATHTRLHPLIRPDCQVRLGNVFNSQNQGMVPSSSTIHKECSLAHKSNDDHLPTCLASTAAVYSFPKLRSVYKESHTHSWIYHCTTSHVSDSQWRHHPG